MNLRSYYPDFAAVDEKGTRWLLETKGAETPIALYPVGIGSSAIRLITPNRRRVMI